MFKQFIILRIALLLVSLVCLFGPAAPMASASEIDRFLEDSTVVVAHVDLTQLDLPGMIKQMRQRLPDLLPEQEVMAFQIFGNGILQTLRKSGVQHMYATLSLLELTTGQVAIIIPTRDPETLIPNLSAITSLLPASLNLKVVAGPDVVLIANEAVGKRLLQSPTAKRDELRVAIDSLSQQTLGFAIGIDGQLRQAVSSLWPDQVPQEVPIQFSPKQIMQDVHSWQLSTTGTRNLEFQLHADCMDGPAALRTQDVLKRLLGYCGIELPVNVTGPTNVSIRLDTREDIVIEKLMSRWLQYTADAQESNDLKQLGVAMHNFHQAHNYLPPRMTVSPQGKPLLSWRVFLLPFLGHQALYAEFHLDEPWDSPHNQKLIERMPTIYRSKGSRQLPAGQTLMQLPLIDGAPLAGDERRQIEFGDIQLPFHQTLCIIIAPADKAVIWTQPMDLQLDARRLVVGWQTNRLVESLFGNRESIQVVMFDSSVQSLQRSVPDAELLKLLNGR